jgi:hypothetical protein
MRKNDGYKIILKKFIWIYNFRKNIKKDWKKLNLIFSMNLVCIRNKNVNFTIKYDYILRKNTHYLSLFWKIKYNIFFG